MKKNKQRCPGCGSGDFYRRTRTNLWTEKSKAQHKGMEGKDFENKLEKKSKKYRCKKCKFEFDTPIIFNS